MFRHIITSFYLSAAADRRHATSSCALLLVLLMAACTERAPEVTIASSPAEAASNSADPALALDPANGDIVMTWVGGDSSRFNLYFARSADGGSSWSAPVRVTQVDNDVKPHGQASPRIVATRGMIAVFWPNNIVVEGRRFPASHLRFSRSTDGGRTWSRTATLNDDTTSALAGHTFHGAVFVPPSTLAVAWLDSRSQDVSHMTETRSHAHAEHDGDATIYMAVSKDLGATWAMQNAKLWGDACPCCRVSLAARPDGKIIASWRSHLPGDVRDPVVAEVSETPAPPVRVHTDDWVFAGCPHTGPSLDVDRKGVTRVAWFSGRPGRSGIFYAQSNADTLAFSKPVEIIGAAALPTAHPAITAAHDAVLVAYDVNQLGKPALSIARVDGESAKSVTLQDSEGADHPQIVALENGALVAWTQKRSNRTTVRVARIR